ncbi:PREDICTED: glucose dehydrogenase [FAD, quinone]-like [Acromyrmex echinatior]|uniref:Glucose dehydrogenase n=1 Tax=Acromyrmex echinatior TaxID=103372 RepID=F4WQN4_ACREC|nr:PREDICTED: glucose dehydrogenase [FAD, quinone]-like [Acromyrmex echinatior]XP_011057665.1 PREDICTED: glucose dehydrogenase [FAD, quinone]-like [Acromyrmex echinatior]XP_011057666.1 PREDICTED: glucose dehydrogenase [FAD, quinone]-like [Acromyrmex echinatior]EGI63397.1 Glucose dehydrogenase [Acromyrmex echinatior]
MFTYQLLCLNISSKVTSLLLILSIMISLLQSHEQPPPNWYHRLYGNNMNESKLFNIINLNNKTLNFLEQSQRFRSEEVSDMTPQYNETFDFIVIGAGTAGATIAARLSEISEVKILLIEAGFHESFFMDIPMIAPILSSNSNINWKYKTRPSNKYCLGMKDNSCIFPAGKIIGGSSVLNFMAATRGNAEDYDRWAEMGNEGWAYKDVLKYFKKLETMDIPELKSDIKYHGTNGPVHINHLPSYTPLAEAFLEAGKELGYSELVDYNGKNQIGFSYLQFTIMNGTRMSSNRAYLHPIHNRKNLHVTLQSIVTKVLIDSSTNRSVGVEFTKKDRTIRVFASKEVILCAGAIKSPQLLMLSGIGPAKHLTELGIDVIRDASVGKNLMDHATFYGLTWTSNVSINSQFFNFINPHIKTLPLTSKGEAIGFINTKQPEKRNDLPNIELLFASGPLMEDFILSRLLNYKNPLRQEWKYSDGHDWFLGPILLKPKSRGQIMLLANDINVKPDIVPNYFDNPDDIKTMIAGIRTALSIGHTKAMQAFDSKLSNITYTECNDYEYDSDAYWECVSRIMTSTLFHYSGTCKMGAKEDSTAVVDPKLKVIGIQGLRVADASIMPEITSGHLNIPVYMIAEKAADMIKEEWGFLKKSC